MTRSGSPQGCSPSSFLRELPADLIDQRELSAIMNAPVEQSSVKDRFGSIFAALDRVAP